MNKINKSPRLFFWSRVVSIGAIIVVILFTSYGFYLASKVETMQQQWITYNLKFTKIANELQELHDALGYGGLIHDFKNYVLRYNDKYDQRTQIAFQESWRVLTNLQNSLNEHSALEDTQEIKRTVDEYYRNYQLIRGQGKLHSNAEARDKVVKVNDGPAFEALGRLRQFIVSQSELQQVSTNNAVDQVLKLVYKGVWFVPMLLIALLMMNILMGRLRAAYIEVQNAREFIDNLLSHSPDALIVLNSQGHIIRSNTKATELFGYSENEFANMTIERLMPEKYRDGHIGLRNEFITQGISSPVMSRPLPIQTKNGDSPICEIALSTSGEGQAKIITASIRDVSERERTRTELKEAKFRAEVNLKRLQTAQDYLVRSEKLVALGGLVAGIAHEINTPIGTTVTAATHLEDETQRIKKMYENEDLGADELEEYFSICNEATRLISLNCKRAADLILSFKQVAVDQTSEEKRIFDLKTYIEEIILSLRPELKKHPHQIEIKCQPDITLNSYPGMFSQLLSNLIVNSLTHAWDEGEQGIIQINVDNISDNQVKIIYHDNGKGIPISDQDKVFDPFFTTKRGNGGSGLGLHILHNLIYQRLEGELQLNSSENNGTTFTIILPKSISPRHKVI